MLKKFKRLPDLKTSEGIIKIQAIFYNNKQDPGSYQLSINKNVYRIDAKTFHVFWANNPGWLNISKYKTLFKPEYGPYNHVSFYLDDEIASLISRK
jgi:hypothetical protein